MGGRRRWSTLATSTDLPPAHDHHRPNPQPHAGPPESTGDACAMAAARVVRGAPRGCSTRTASSDRPEAHQPHGPTPRPRVGSTDGMADADVAPVRLIRSASTTNRPCVWSAAPPPRMPHRRGLQRPPAKHTSTTGPIHNSAPVRQTAQVTRPWQRCVGQQCLPWMLNQNGLKRPPASTPVPWAHATPARRLDRRHGGLGRGSGEWVRNAPRACFTGTVSSDLTQ